ncbi:PepSY-associated TM helix domain-containing protein [Caldimonas sp. KR1-144]|uniref:PepSY-associated TM helix domain-containing protein n=1 Tax=Caldimonas sp. KR1-144 TaxID=3400911 RepID=UPI003C009309
MRRALVLVHRWFGLAAAAFLFVAGLTGAVISWDHELDGWLNPQFFEARSEGPAKPTLELAAQVEAADARVRVTYLPLNVEPGHALGMSVAPRVDPKTGALFEPGYNQVAVDPATGEVQGRREWGAISLDRENLLPFLYKLHYSLHLPEFGAFRLGVWLFGLIAIGWVIDCAIALAISFPSPAAWRKSFAFRWRKGGYPLVFDAHRSGGVWLWPLLLIIAITSVSMNLGNEVTRPVVSWFSTLSPSPFASRAPAPLNQPVEPKLGFAQAIALAKDEASRRGWTLPAGAVFYSPDFGIYGVGFFEPGNDHGDGGLGNPWLYFDALDGRPAGEVVPGEGSAGDLFMQLQFPLHSGRIAGVAGRALMSVLGLSVATLSVTGVVIWLRKRRARRAQAAPERALGPRAPA